MNGKTSMPKFKIISFNPESNSRSPSKKAWGKIVVNDFVTINFSLFDGQYGLYFKCGKSWKDDSGVWKNDTFLNNKSEMYNEILMAMQNHLNNGETIRFKPPEIKSTPVNDVQFTADDIPF